MVKARGGFGFLTDATVGEDLREEESGVKVSWRLPVTWQGRSA